MKYLSIVLFVVALANLSACSQVKPSPDAKAKQQYETYGPKFTEEQKANLSAEERAAIYNAEVRPEDRVICHRERVVGSHFRQERCFTQAEIDDAKIAADALLRQASGNAVTAGD